MSGHSKWANIKNQKGAADARRGQLFTKISREIILAVREHGSDPAGNPRLRLCIQKARDSNMPTENIERAIKRGAGTLEGMTIDEFVLEGYGPGGAALLVDVLSDNRNRTIQEVRSVFTRAGGSLGEVGSVNWQFEQKGIISIEVVEGMNADDISLMAIDTCRGCEADADYIEIYTSMEDMETSARRWRITIPVKSAELAKVANNMLELMNDIAVGLKLIDRLENLDDVRVWSNVEFTDEVMEKYEGSP